MVDVEELMSKIKSGVWSTQDAFDCIKDLEQEYCRAVRQKSGVKIIVLPRILPAMVSLPAATASVYFL